MLVSGCLSFGATGRVLVDLVNPPLYFNGGTPIASTGGVAVSLEDPDNFVSGIGYESPGDLCVRDQVPAYHSSGFGRTAAGGLALDTTNPIVGYVYGIPVTADGRVAVEIIGPPPNLSGFTDGFESTAFF